jgi:hypothetical protein
MPAESCRASNMSGHCLSGREGRAMTVKADIVAVLPTANAKAVVSAKGADINGLMTLLQQHAIEMQALVKQVIALHPGGGGDAANLTALNSILSELL